MPVAIGTMHARKPCVSQHAVLQGSAGKTQRNGWLLKWGRGVRLGGWTRCYDDPCSIAVHDGAL